MCHCWNAIKIITLSIRFFLGGLAITVSKYYTHWQSSWYIWQSVVQRKNTCSQTSQRSKLSKCGNKMDGWPLCSTATVLGFVPAMRFLQSLSWLCKSPLDETINWGPLCVCVCVCVCVYVCVCKFIMHSKRSCMHVKDSVAHVRIW